LHDNYNLETSHLIPALIRKFYIASKDNSQVEIWGDGTPRREFMYSGDIPKIIDIILKNNIIFEDMIISPSQSHSINKFCLKYGLINEPKKKLR
jgi:GDP-L-fucose synthase